MGNIGRASQATGKPQKLRHAGEFKFLESLYVYGREVRPTIFFISFSTNLNCMDWDIWHVGWQLNLHEEQNTAYNTVL